MTIRTRRGAALRLALVACLAAALAVPAGAAGAQAPADEPPPGGVPGVTVPELDWAPCAPVPGGGELAAGAECTTAQVPLRYDQPGGETLELALARRPADDQANKIGSLFFNFGGPGGTAADLVAQAGDFLLTEEVRARFDLVGVDPRGIGASTPVSCFTSLEDAIAFFGNQPPFPVTPLEVASRARQDRALSERCDEAEGDLLDNVSTTALVRDLDVLRAAVGDEQMTFVGYSYGTYVGAVYANLFPTRVRAHVLDAVLDPVDYTNGPRGTIADVRTEADEGAYQTLLQFFRTCAEAQEACAFSEGDPEAKYAELAAALRRRPVTLETPDGPVRVGYAELVSSSLGAMYSPLAWPDYAAFLAEVDAALPAGRGAGLGLARLRERLQSAQDRFRDADDGTPFQGPEGGNAVWCSDSDNPETTLRWASTARQRDRVAPYFGSAWTWANSVCASWEGVANDRYTGPWTAATANPVLVVGERFDPATNYEDAVKLSNLLPNSDLLTVEGFGHTAQLSACADETVSRYLVDLTRPEPGAVCFQDIGPFDPLPPSEVAAAELSSDLALSNVPAIAVPLGD